MFHVNCLHRKQFAWNVKPYFLCKNKKKKEDHLLFILHKVFGEANNVEPDETLQNVTSELDLYCLPHIQQVLDTPTYCKTKECSKFRISDVLMCPNI